MARAAPFFKVTQQGVWSIKNSALQGQWWELCYVLRETGTSVSSSLAKLKQYCKCPQTHTARGCGVLPPHSDHTGHDLGRGSWPEAPVCPWWSRGASAWAKLALPSWPLHSTGSGVGSRLCAALPRHTRPGGPGCMIGLRGWRLGYLG